MCNRELPIQTTYRCHCHALRGFDEGDYLWLAGHLACLVYSDDGLAAGAGGGASCCLEDRGTRGADTYRLLARHWGEEKSIDGTALFWHFLIIINVPG